MELSEFGYVAFGFCAGMAWGSLLTFYVFYSKGKQNKSKTQVNRIEERLTELEKRVKIL